MSSISIINDDLRRSISRLKQEVENDIYFFGACGLAVGVMLIWEGRFKELGILNNSQWARALFNDFLPGRAFGFIFAVYVLFGVIANSYGCSSEKINNLIKHIGNRLHQIGSSIISFALGFSAFASICFLIRFELDGIILSVIAFLFASFFTEIIILAEFLTQRKNPFDKSFAVIIVIILLNYLSIQLLAA